MLTRPWFGSQAKWLRVAGISATAVTRWCHQWDTLDLCALRSPAPLI